MPIDYRTDSGTLPTEEMRQAMYNARLGDDYYGEDPSVNLLEKTAAEMLGKEAAILTTTATLGNQLALLSQSREGSDIWVEKMSHIATHDYTAFLLPDRRFHTYEAHNGRSVRDDDLAAAKKGTQPLFCIENTHNRHGGTILPLSEMKRIHDQIGQAAGCVHLDGSRLFNASVATGVPINDFAACADTVVLCLCKGLSAPAGAVLAGSRETIRRARRWRAKMGAAMPQAGIIAAPAYVALKKMILRLAQDHLLAKQLAAGLAELPGLFVDLSLVETNIVLVHPAHSLKTAGQIRDELGQAGILVLLLDGETIRFVIDRNIAPQDLPITLEVMQSILKSN
ncbi:GntG family PLP-dependent aldolase [Sporolactobacillus sp. KGMB 08714]|uniref:GntG family PLP-dependent aldolase n=1 Tax=Sporolactobacillus sp. KGMB 08714 TaxID=3064704 RepID=UPI002FBE2C15